MTKFQKIAAAAGIAVLTGNAVLIGYQIAPDAAEIDSAHIAFHQEGLESEFDRGMKAGQEYQSFWCPDPRPTPAPAPI
jgi:hypothetical protein